MVWLASVFSPTRRSDATATTLYSLTHPRSFVYSPCINRSDAADAWTERFIYLLLRRLLYICTVTTVTKDITMVTTHGGGGTGLYFIYQGFFSVPKQISDSLRRHEASERHFKHHKHFNFSLSVRFFFLSFFLKISLNGSRLRSCWINWQLLSGV